MSCTHEFHDDDGRCRYCAEREASVNSARIAALEERIARLVDGRLGLIERTLQEQIGKHVVIQTITDKYPIRGEVLRLSRGAVVIQDTDNAVDIVVRFDAIGSLHAFRGHSKESA